jgi:hypothetical protein
MITKVDNKITDLVEILGKNLSWNLARKKFLAFFICSITKLQTVCFVKIAQDLNPDVKHESNLRRIQRFFSDFIVDHDIIAKLLFSLLPSQNQYKLCLDRTNWKYGKADINILVLSACYEGLSIPLLWKMLPKSGNSNSEERKELLCNYIRLFGTNTIHSLLADREFIGDDWFDNLIFSQVPFFIRIRNNMKVKKPGKKTKKAFWLFNDLPLNTPRYYRKPLYIKNQLVYLSGLKVVDSDNKIEFVIIASFNYNDQALEHYKDRWQTETMFKALKSSGFNFEQTHLSDPDKISKLLAVMSIAFVWAYRIGVFIHKNICPIKIKKHGRKAYSFFKYGLIALAKVLLSNDYQLFGKYLKFLSCT